jgi:hypothetical protein
MGKVIKDFEPQILKLLEFRDSSAENLPPRESRGLRSYDRERR